MTDDELIELAFELDKRGESEDLLFVIEELEMRGHFKPKEPSTLETFIDKMATVEGTEAHKDVGGVDTQPFGVVNTMGLSKEEDEDDKSFALRLAEKHKESISKEVPTFEDQPEAVKQVLLSVHWNTGKVFNKLKKAVNDKNYQEAGNQLLDIVTQSEGPNIPKGERWVIPGLLKRRADEYNLLAEEFGFSPITSYSTEQTDEGVKIEYKTEDGVLFEKLVPNKDKLKTVIPSSGRSGEVSLNNKVNENGRA